MLKSLKKLLLKNESTEYFWYLRNKTLKAKNIICRVFYHYKYRKLMKAYGCSIPLDASIEGMPTFPHGLYGIFISQGAVIGRGVVIFHQVTIGSNTLKDSKGAGTPVIKDNVFIGVGAKVIGKVTVGTNARIGANTVVVNDVPDNATVVLSDVRIIQHNGPRDNAFIGHKEYRFKT